MTPFFAFIESNTTGSGELFLKSAIDLGFAVLFLTSNPTKYPFLSKNEGKVLLVDTTNFEKVLQTLESYPRLKGVYSTSDYYVEITARIAKKLGLPGNNPESIGICRNKDLFYKRLQNAPVSLPKTWVLQNPEELEAIREELVYPLVIKPSSGSGSIGVKKCFSYEDLFSQYQKILKEAGFHQSVLLQKYIFGMEYSAEIIRTKTHTWRLGLTKKYTTNNHYFVETGHDFPAILEESLQEKIWNTIERILEDVGFTFGPAHIEFKIYGSEIVIIEINPRLAGGMIPELLCMAMQFDIYQILIQLFSGESPRFVKKTPSGASIRFFLAPLSGLIHKLPDTPSLLQLENVVSVQNTKSVGESVELLHNFKDRIGFLITHSQDPQKAKISADKAIKKAHIEIYKEQGRISSPPHSAILRIVRHPISHAQLKRELIDISHLDLAYLLMLTKQRLLNPEQTLSLICSIQKLQKNIEKIAVHLDYSRGSYYAYEKYLEAELGVQISGNNHIGRSRNDMQATLLLFCLKRVFQQIFYRILDFMHRIVDTAAQSHHIPLPIYSQYQPALPGNYSYYLMALYENLHRILTDFIHLEPLINTSPLGSGAGSGTDLPIDPFYVAELLGFKNSATHALDAIANRDTALRFASILSNLSILFSRIAQDFQIWTTKEFQFFVLPDALCGSSSMMPQKKNPYILEIIKNKAVDISIEAHAMHLKMHKVPIGNSVEVSSAALDPIYTLQTKCSDCLELLQLVISEALPQEKNMLLSHKKGVTVAVHIANELMRNRSISFREAHRIVGSLIKELSNTEQDIYLSLIKSLSLCLPDTLEEYLENLNSKLRFGGGPGKIETMEKKALRELDSLYRWIDTFSLHHQNAKALLKEKISRFCSSLTLS